MATTATVAMEEDELVPISALQHMLYCPRQCALIHVEQQWAENRFTAEGRIMHRRADAGGEERRGRVRTERRVPLRSLGLGVFGVADVVEMHDGLRPLPIEYKRGRPKSHRADEVQICAQAIVLRDNGYTCGEGIVYYQATKQRVRVPIDEALTEDFAE